MNKLDIKTVRISAEHAGPSREDFKTKRQKIINTFSSAGINVIDGTAGEAICLSGEKGVQTHIRKSDAYVFFGQLTIGEMLKACSIFVGLQTLDPDLHIKGADGAQYLKPLMLYGSAAHGWLYKQLELLKHHGTISQELEGPNRIVRRPETIDDLLPELLEPIQKPVKSMHGMGENIDPKWRDPQCGTETMIDVAMPDYRVCVFTSARFLQDELSEKEAYNLGNGIARMDGALITGLGKCGLMWQVHRGAVENGGLSYGSNCPHIIKLEGVPNGFAEAWVTPDIYERMARMVKPSDAIIISGGGRGGAGTFQEALACILLMARSSRSMTSRNKDGSFKPMIIDNRLDMWGPLIEISKQYGLVEGLHFHVTKGTDQTLDVLSGLKSGSIKAATQPPVPSTPAFLEKTKSSLAHQPELVQ